MRQEHNRKTATVTELILDFFRSFIISQSLWSPLLADVEFFQKTTPAFFLVNACLRSSYACTHLRQINEDRAAPLSLWIVHAAITMKELCREQRWPA
jgi:hypothetical protein